MPHSMQTLNLTCPLDRHYDFSNDLSLDEEGLSRLGAIQKTIHSRGSQSIFSQTEPNIAPEPDLRINIYCHPLLSA